MEMHATSLILPYGISYFLVHLTSSIFTFTEVQLVCNMHIKCNLIKAIRPRGYKTVFMLNTNSVEHEILHAHKDKKIK